MRKSLLSVLLAVLCSVAVHGADIGYTNGYYNRYLYFHIGTGKAQGMAIRLDNDKLKLLKGKTITGIKSIYGSKKTEGNITAFVTTDLNAAPLTKQEYTLSSTEISSSTAKWIEKSFDTPYVITGEEEALYIGYSCTLTDLGAMILSTDYSMDVEGCTYAIMNDEWIDMYGKGRGSANLKVVLDDTPAFTDIVMKRGYFNGYYKVGEEYTFSGEVLNFGTETITSFDIEVKTDKTQTIHIDNVEVLPGTTYNFTLPQVKAEMSGKQYMSMKVVKVNGGEDADNTDNLYGDNVFFYPSAMENSLLVEAFTGQACSNCPSGHTTMGNVLSQTPYKWIEVAHHAGYYPDNFTMAEDIQYTLFYGSGGTYAPAFMVNRLPNYDTNIPVMEISRQNVTNMLDYAAQQRPYASLKLETEYDKATRQVTVRYHVYTHETMPGKDNVLNIMLVQNGIKDYQVNGGNEYPHNHTCRGTVTGNEWGLRADFKEGETLTYEKTFTLPETIRSSYWTEADLANAGKTEDDITKAVVPEDITLVGYVANYTSNDHTLNQVYNAIEVKLGESYTQAGFVNGSTGIDHISGVSDNLHISVAHGKVEVSGAYDSLTLFDTAGRQHNICSTLPKGMYIVKAVSGGRTIAKKIVVR